MPPLDLGAGKSAGSDVDLPTCLSDFACALPASDLIAEEKLLPTLSAPLSESLEESRKHQLLWSPILLQPAIQAHHTKCQISAACQQAVACSV